MAAARRAHPEQPRSPPVERRSPVAYPARPRGQLDADGFFEVHSRRNGHSRSPCSPPACAAGSGGPMLQLPRIWAPPCRLFVPGLMLQLLDGGAPRCQLPLPGDFLRSGIQTGALAVPYGRGRPPGAAGPRARGPLGPSTPLPPRPRSAVVPTRRRPWRRAAAQRMPIQYMPRRRLRVSRTAPSLRPHLLRCTLT